MREKMGERGEEGNSADEDEAESVQAEIIY